MKLNTIYNEDCLEGMKRIPDSSIDIVITSPPYNKAGYEGFIRKPHKRDAWKNRRNIDYGNDPLNDFMGEDTYKQWQIDILNEIHRILKDDGSVFYNHKIRIAKHRASHPIEWISQSKLNFRQQIVWDRGSSPNVSKIRYMPTSELMFWLTKTNIQPRFERVKDTPYKTDVWRINPEKDNSHPATFPVELVDAILVNIPKGDERITVLDPFMGVGKTAESSIRHGMDFIGFELDEDYYNIAQNRIKNHTQQLSLI